MVLDWIIERKSCFSVYYFFHFSLLRIYWMAWSEFDTDQAPVSSSSTLFSFSFDSKYSQKQENSRSQQATYSKIQQRFFSHLPAVRLSVCLYDSHNISTLNWRHSLFLYLENTQKTTTTEISITIHRSSLSSSRECSIFYLSV